MLKTVIVLPDGTELSSGAGTENAIKSIVVTECVNDGQELMLGSTCTNMIELTAITPNGGFSIAKGDEFTVYRETAEGVCHKVGLFTSEKPTRASAHSLKVTAYDRISWLDQDLTAWIAGLTAWPYTLYDLARMTCQQCGVQLRNTEIPNGTYLVQHFSAQGITGRQIMKWVGQIAGRFCRATPDGEIEFAWYTPSDTHITTYYQGGFSYSDYQVSPIEKVQLKCSEDDVGTVYPDDLLDAVNTYAVSGNALLTATGADDLKPIAQALYEQLKAVTYTPCKISIPAGFHIHAGDIVKVTNINGVTVTAFVMTKKQAGQRDTLECTGSPRRDSSSAVNEQSYAALSGKVFNLQMNVDGLKLENQDTAGKLASLSLDLDGISAKVQKQSEDMEGITQNITELQQDGESVKLSIKSIQDNGVSKVKTETGFSFDQKGLHISKSDSDMENTLDETGMYVRRNGEDLLRANDDGVLATDVTVLNYLEVGSHARFEDYANNRTACFWL